MRIKSLRESNKMSQQQVADTLGLPLNTYRNYERGERQPPIEVLFSIADLYDVTLDYLLERDTSEDDAIKTHLLILYGMLDDDGKNLLITMARMIVKSGEFLSI